MGRGEEGKEWKPKAYQEKGVELLVQGGGAGLLLDPGMGKTAVVLAAFEELKTLKSASKMLVVAPIKPMYGTWPAEVEKWEQFRHLRVRILHGKYKDGTLRDGDGDIFIINPEGLKWLFKQPEEEIPDFDVLCVDESTKFKNFTSKRSKMLRKRLHWFSYRWILTGTVCPNGLKDLFGQVYIMDRGAALGRYITHFMNTYFYKPWEGSYDYVPFEGAMENISNKIAHMVLRLDAEDYLDMPDLMVIPRMVELPTAAVKLYKEIEDEFIAEVAGSTLLAPNSAAAGTKCRQIANGAVYDMDGEPLPIHDKKLEALEEIVEETNGHPLLILYEFRHDRDRIMELLGSKAVCITGKTGKQLEVIIKAFNVGSIPYLVAHPGTTHGLNIQGHCYHMVWFCITWNLEHYIQAVWRLYRQGQSAKVVMCYHLIAKGTLDEKVVEVLDYKEANQEKLEQLLTRSEG